MTRALSKHDRQELIALAEKRGKLVTELEAQVDGLESGLARERLRATGLEAEVRVLQRGRAWALVSRILGVVALAWCCYLVGSGVLVWPWRVW